MFHNINNTPEMIHGMGGSNILCDNKQEPTRFPRVWNEWLNGWVGGRTTGRWWYQKLSRDAWRIQTHKIAEMLCCFNDYKARRLRNGGQTTSLVSWPIICENISTLKKRVRGICDVGDRQTERPTDRIGELAKSFSFDMNEWWRNANQQQAPKAKRFTTNSRYRSSCSTYSGGENVHMHTVEEVKKLLGRLDYEEASGWKGAILVTFGKALWGSALRRGNETSKNQNVGIAVHCQLGTL